MHRICLHGTKSTRAFGSIRCSIPLTEVSLSSRWRQSRARRAGGGWYTELLTNSEYQLSMRALHGLYFWGLFPAKNYSDALYPM